MSTSTAVLFPCAACGHRVHPERWGSGRACPVCGWIDDLDQLAHPDLAYGANAGQSLRQAQVQVSDTVAVERALATSNGRDPRWRALRSGETPAADPEGPSSPVCYLGVPDRAAFVPYWLRGRG